MDLGGGEAWGCLALKATPCGCGAFLGFSNRPSMSHNVVAGGTLICNGSNCVDSDTPRRRA